MRSNYKNKRIDHFWDDDKDDDTIVETIGKFKLVQEKHNRSFEYKVFDNLDHLIDHWFSSENCLVMPSAVYERSYTKDLFDQIVQEEKAKKQPKQKNKKNSNPGLFFSGPDDEKDDDLFSIDKEYISNKHFFEPFKATGFLDKLNKSDTLVIHCLDNTTNMLSQIYEGRNWDVLRDGNIDKEELHQLLESHDKIICLGHGTPGGLINVQGGGYIIGDEEAKYLKGKKLFMIWCHASSYAIRHGLHGFITGNMPSDAWEARSVGFNVAQKYMDDNITFWSKCCAKYVNQALNGNPEGAAANIRKEYLAVYGDEYKWNDQEIGITKYNAERTIAI